MTYDDHAKLLGAKTIGTVESNLDWQAINYNDPITVGYVQWFGTRAAAILKRMKLTEHWSGVAASIDNDLDTISSSATFWNSRYLTVAEGDSLKPVLLACDFIQVDQMETDMETYKNVAVSEGMDPDTDTAAMLMFFTAYHQGPVYALEALQASVGYPHPTLANLRDAILAHPVLGQYPARYNDAYDLILADDVSGMPTPGGDPEPPDPGGGNGGAGSTRSTKYLTIAGDNAILYFTDGQRLLFYPDGKGRFIPRRGSATEPTEPPEPPPTGGDWVHPLPTGILTSGYGPRPSIGDFHHGADFATPGYSGKIYAPADMVVTQAGFGLGSFNNSAGWAIKAHTLDGAYTFAFYHMQSGSLKVRAGDTVTKGTWIGIEGGTGFVIGIHLHFEIYPGNYDNPWPPPYGPATVDPIPLMESKGITIK